MDALFFPRLFDRWRQNLRRCAGYKVQYFAAIEPQRRLAPHLHAAIRGAIPRATIRAGHQGHLPAAVVAALRPARLRRPGPPVWDGGGATWTRTPAMPLPTWEQALDELDARPGRAAGAW